jgi:acyl-coenzyme A thioesterase PaaI-like protein
MVSGATEGAGEVSPVKPGIEEVLTPEWANGLGNLHGAAAAWLVDVCVAPRRS